MDEMHHLSADELQAKLEALSTEREALKVALEQRHEAEKVELADEIKALITERGHDIDEIAQKLQGRTSGRKRRRQRAAANEANANYTRYADPDNPSNIYIRGRMPNWLIEKMAANGYDPANAEHRQQFKTQHLVELAA
ncbi:MAG: H-NS histone family protein [Gammaproteobacteria bacterium]|nr:H-NS histone family protein [Gammaproteobacteria bacterium]